jgi:hypothetical protein
MGRAGLALLFFLAILALPAGAQSSPGNSAVIRGAKNLRVPLGEDPARPSAMLIVEEVASRARHIGPFRLGLFQRIVLEGVTIDLSGQARRGLWVSDLADYFRFDEAGAAPVFERLLIRDRSTGAFVSSSSAFLSAERRALVMRKVSVRLAGGRKMEFSEAAIALAGDSSGTSLLTGQDNEEKILVFP